MSHWGTVDYSDGFPRWILNRQVVIGYKTDYIFSATYKDFVKVLMDEKYQSIVLVGHGSFNCWKATDELVSTYDIERLTGKFKKNRANGSNFHAHLQTILPNI